MQKARCQAGLREILGCSFFHWPLEFPEVFAKGGFDVALSNPPWERINLKEEEFFATRDARVASIGKKSERQRLIQALKIENPGLWQEYRQALREADSFDKFLRQSLGCPLTARGDINTYAVFAEHARNLLNPIGRAGIVVPIGIATDETTRVFFSDLTGKRAIIELIGFENEAFIFPAVHHSFKFCALTIAGEGIPVAQASLTFFCRHFNDVRNPARRFVLSSEDLELLNPNSRTCPVFRTSTDCELTKAIYRRVPVLFHEHSGANPWGVYLRRMFHMADDSSSFYSGDDLEDRGLHGSGARFGDNDEMWVPLYEAKMVYHFDHRYSTYSGATQAQQNVGTLPQPTPEKKSDPAFVVVPRYWVSIHTLKGRFEQWNREEVLPFCSWACNWLLGFRDITSAVVERTAIFSLLPKTGVGHTAPLVFVKGAPNSVYIPCLLANLNSLTVDYVARQKVGGTHLTYSLLNQFPVLPPDVYNAVQIEHIAPRVIELVYTAWDIKSFADDVWRDSDENLKQLIRCQWEENKAATGGHEWNPPEWAEIIEDGIPLPPFKWDEDRRAQIRAELDAYYALLYGLTRDELRYVLDPKDVYGPNFPSETFRVLKEKEMKRFGEYRTRRLVLEAYDQLVAQGVGNREFAVGKEQTSKTE